MTTSYIATLRVDLEAKISAIKALRCAIGFGLHEAKNLVETAKINRSFGARDDHCLDVIITAAQLGRLTYMEHGRDRPDAPFHAVTIMTVVKYTRNHPVDLRHIALSID